jgi:hypothetical protein
VPGLRRYFLPDVRTKSFASCRRHRTPCHNSRNRIVGIGSSNIDSSSKVALRDRRYRYSSYSRAASAPHPPLADVLLVNPRRCQDVCSTYRRKRSLTTLSNTLPGLAW